MNTVVHLIVGPTHHGVCRHGLLVAEALNHRVVHVESPDFFDSASVGWADTVHIPYTDRLFAERCEDSAAKFEALVQPLLDAGQNVSVTLHDLPAGESERELRRRSAYQQVVSMARGVVVNSRRELVLLDALNDQARSRRRIPLPVLSYERVDGQPGTDVAVLGFLFPDRGYEHTVSELPGGVSLTALGGPAAGHDDLADELVALARAGGREMRMTGFIPDEDLAGALAGAGVPVAPNRRVAASASIATWIGHGRRPLVPISPYTLELNADNPGTVLLYDADQPGELQACIAKALADPALTYLDADAHPGPTLDDVATMYADHFETVAPDRPVPVGSGRWTVPGNRWDLLHSESPSETPMVSVVIPYFEAQEDLDRVLAGLTRQTHPRSRLQVVVADDGSSTPLHMGAAKGLDTVIARQENRGFRAAAARNMGAAAADGTVLLFLDGDTTPEPEYVSRMARLPSIAPDVIGVGRRRHADFDGDIPRELDEPAWLVEAYQRSQDLLMSDERAYRFVISAVMGMNKELFAELGGFSEEFTAYGGEDWELAHRSYAAGAVLAHVRDAVAWHHGPDWGDRQARPDKNRETLALARLLPDPIARGGGQWVPFPSLAIRLHTGDAAAALLTVRSAFNSGADCGFWTLDRSIAETLDDPRVHYGPVPSSVLSRASLAADMVPADLTRLPQLMQIALGTGRLSTPSGTFWACRAVNRARRWAGSSDCDTLAIHLFGTKELGWPVPLAEVDLERNLTALGERVFD